jgi:CHAT domain-containing protein
VIHLATHGFYLEGACDDGSETALPGDTLMYRENPLLRSGLLLAGANLHGAQADSLAVDDGILTADEVSGLDLGGARLVVLSACETGLGDVKRGEGVYGLRRAFLMAGARTVISSLWPVPDQQTAEIMATLYTQGDQPLAARLREAQLAQLKAIRESNGINHPFTWGAFVAIGDWR